MKKIFGTLIVILISQIGFSQDYQSEFQKFCETNDTINQLKTLKKWQSEKPKDAELFTSYFNYHFMKSRQEVLALTTDQPNGESLVLKDSLNQNAGFLGSQIQYEQSELKKGLNKIDEGIKLYPNRLDMRFGKIYALGQIPDWKNFTSEILKTIEFSAKNKNQWTWTNNQKYNGGEKEFLLDIQNYQLQLYNTGNDDLLKNMREISNKVLEFYPNHIESLSNLSITYLLTGEYDKGIEPLLRAEKINPKDYIVLGNIAQGYKLKGDKKKAIEYYEKTAEYFNYLLFIYEFTIGFDIKFIFIDIQQLVDQIDSSELLESNKKILKKRIKRELNIEEYLAFIEFFEKNSGKIAPLIPMIYERVFKDDGEKVIFKSITETSLKEPYDWYKENLN